MGSSFGVIRGEVKKQNLSNYTVRRASRKKLGQTYKVLVRALVEDFQIRLHGSASLLSTDIHIEVRQVGDGIGGRHRLNRA